MPKLLYPDLSLSTETIEPKSKLERDLFSCNPDATAYATAYVSKMFAVARKDLPENKRRALTAQEMRERGKELRQTKGGTKDDDKSERDSVNAIIEDEAQSDAPLSVSVKAAADADIAILGFARLYSGILRRGSTIFCVLPKFNKQLGLDHPRNSGQVIKAEVEALYEMMGRDLEPVDEVRAGNVFAMRGLEGKVWRNATLCSPIPMADQSSSDSSEASAECLINLGGIQRQVCPISTFV